MIFFFLNNIHVHENTHTNKLQLRIKLKIRSFTSWFTIIPIPILLLCKKRILYFISFRAKKIIKINFLFLKKQVNYLCRLFKKEMISFARACCLVWL